MGRRVVLGKFYGKPRNRAAFHTKAYRTNSAVSHGRDSIDARSSATMLGQTLVTSSGSRPWNAFPRPTLRDRDEGYLQSLERSALNHTHLDTAFIAAFLPSAACSHAQDVNKKGESLASGH